MNNNISMCNKLFLWSGVIRRFLIYIFCNNFIINNASKRNGKCLQCGACCKLAFKRCPYLVFDTDGKSSCMKYYKCRMPNCKSFPIDYRDIKERDIISENPCGYYFL